VRLAWMMVAFGLVCVPRLAMAGTLSWSQAFVAERDTMLFMGSDGTLLRAPVSARLSGPRGAASIWCGCE
jgi:hypothetical protein